ncbi:MAG: T9SS type A sorting domain-containing protein [Chitinophagaceae bacterium]
MIKPYIYITLFICSCFGSSFLNAQNQLKTGKIPIDGNRWYQLNNTTSSLAFLFDGKTNSTLTVGWSLLYNNWNAIYTVMPNENITIQQIKMFDWEGIYTDKPMTVSVVNEKGDTSLLAVFKGERYKEWVGPNANNSNDYQVNKIVKNIKYIILNTYGFFPSEIEFYGTYQPITANTAITAEKVPLNNFFGVNGFEWNFLNDANPLFLDSAETKAAAIFTGFRHYMDWERLEFTEGLYTYNPTYKGGWNIDAVYNFCYQNNITVLACINNQPPWMIKTYPANKQQRENSPLIYGYNKANPGSYIHQAKLGFQFAARYGSNKNVPTNLLSVNNTPRWFGDSVNAIKVGLGWVSYIECTNEPDKWWKGLEAYQTAREYAANLSAFYDGHKKQLGENVGVKNADPFMQVVMGGLASINAEYLRGMIDWCRDNRGYKSDGSIDICWDVINYHFYANNAGSSQAGLPTQGASPELSNTAQVFNGFTAVNQFYSLKTPIWITELGYDLNSRNSTQYVPLIAKKTVDQTQTDWLLRSILNYAAFGAERMFIYEMYDLNINGGQFATCGLLDYQTKQPKLAAKIINAFTKQFGDFTFKEQINTHPRLLSFVNKANEALLAIWMPTESNQMREHTINVGNADSVQVFNIDYTAQQINRSLMKVQNGLLTVTASETPLFIQPKLLPTQIQSFNAKIVSKQVLLNWQIVGANSVNRMVIEQANFSTGPFDSLSQLLINSTDNLQSFNYSYGNLSTGNYYYRIKVVLKNGNFFYSTTQQISFSSILLYPNPASGFISFKGLDTNEMYLLQLLNGNGKMVLQKGSLNSQSTINIDFLSKGYYHWLLFKQDTGEKITQSFFLKN